MPRKSLADYRAELQEAQNQIRDLEDENQSLQDQLDQIGGIIAPEEGEEDEGAIDFEDSGDEGDTDRD
jgi:hypothetical protein